MTVKTSQNCFKCLHGYFILEGAIECVTGLHIGGSSDSIEIGGIDHFVMRNPLSRLPYVPGSSVKGRMRSIVEKVCGKPMPWNRKGDAKGMIWRHECDDFNSALKCPVCRVFGSTGKGEGLNHPALLRVPDAMLAEGCELEIDGMPLYEAKTENSLDRLTSAAHPRTIERVPAGASFAYRWTYRVETVGTPLEKDASPSQPVLEPDNNLVSEDLANLLKAMMLVQLDGLGGNVSRGYGEVAFTGNTFCALDSSGTRVKAVEGLQLEHLKPQLADFVKTSLGLMKSE